MVTQSRWKWHCWWSIDEAANEPDNSKAEW